MKASFILFLIPAFSCFQETASNLSNENLGIKLNIVKLIPFRENLPTRQEFGESGDEEGNEFGGSIDAEDSENSQNKTLVNLPLFATLANVLKSIAYGGPNNTIPLNVSTVLEQAASLFWQPLLATTRLRPINVKLLQLPKDEISPAINENN